MHCGKARRGKPQVRTKTSTKEEDINKISLLEKIHWKSEVQRSTHNSRQARLVYAMLFIATGKRGATPTKTITNIFTISTDPSIPPQGSGCTKSSNRSVKKWLRT